MGGFNTNRKQEYDLIFKIVVHAQKMGIAIGDHVTQMMDVEHAHKQFALRLEDWLKADNFNFAHDFCGIQRHINRSTGLVEGFFLPRFAETEGREC